MIFNERERVLGKLRYELTVLTPSPLTRRHPSRKAVQEVGNKTGLAKMLGTIPTIVERAIPPILNLDLPSKEALDFTAAAHYQLAERIAPFYASFADWVDTKVKKSADEGMTDPLIVFEGRDSLGFLYAYSQRHTGEWVYSPGSRAAFRNSSHSNDRTKWTREQQAVIDFYERKGLLGRDLVFVDFGYGGTIFRLEQLALMQHNLPRGLSKLLLAASLPGKDATRSAKGRFLFDSTRKSEFEEADREMMHSREEYFDESPLDRTAWPLPLTGFWEKEWLKVGMPFLLTFQELTSYINESPVETFASPLSRTNISLAPDSLYGIVAKYAFFRGLIGSDIRNIQPTFEAVAGVLNQFCELTRQYPGTYGLLTDLGGRMNTDQSVASVIRRTNRVLRGKRLTAVHS